MTVGWGQTRRGGVADSNIYWNLTDTLSKNDLVGTVTEISRSSRSKTRKGLEGWTTCTVGPNKFPILKVTPTYVIPVKDRKVPYVFYWKKKVMFV